MAALNGAVALAEGGEVAEVVGEHLDFHVARAQDELFKVHVVVGEGSLGFRLSGEELLFEVGRVVHLAHALAAAAGRCLDEHRVAHGLSEGARLFHGIDRAVGTGNSGHAAALHGVAGLALVAHLLDAFGRRANPHEVVVGAGAGEVGVFGKEAVARVDGLGAGVLGGGDNVGHHQVALVGGRGSDADGFVGIAHGQRVGVFGGVHDDRLHAELAAGALYAQGHFPAVGDENLVEH